MSTKRCPFCAEEIQAAAVVCRHCGMDLRTGSFLRQQVPRAPSTVDQPKGSGILRQLTRSYFGWKLIWLSVIVTLTVAASFWTAIVELLQQPQRSELSRTDLEIAFENEGYTFHSISDDNDIPGRAGTPDNGLTWVYLMGPADNLEYATITVTFTEGHEETQLDYLVDFLIITLGDAEAMSDVIDWITKDEVVSKIHTDEVTYSHWNISYQLTPHLGELILTLSKLD